MKRQFVKGMLYFKQYLFFTEKGGVDGVFLRNRRQVVL